MTIDKVTLDNGKYEITVDDKAQMTFYRNGEEWEAGNNYFKHAKVVYCLVQRVLELEQSK